MWQIATRTTRGENRTQSTDSDVWCVQKMSDVLQVTGRAPALLNKHSSLLNTVLGVPANWWVQPLKSMQYRHGQWRERRTENLQRFSHRSGTQRGSVRLNYHAFPSLLDFPISKLSLPSFPLFAQDFHEGDKVYLLDPFEDARTFIALARVEGACTMLCCMPNLLASLASTPMTCLASR